jgi:Domain of unknown function (DUF4129)
MPDPREPHPRAGAEAGAPPRVPSWVAVPVAAGLIALVALASRSTSFAPGSTPIDFAPVLTTLEVIGYVGLAVGTIALLLGAALWRGRMRHLRAERLFGTKRQTAPTPWWVNVLALVTMVGMIVFEAIVVIAYINELRRLADQAGSAGSGGDQLNRAFGTPNYDPAALSVALVIVLGLGVVVLGLILRTRLQDDRVAGGPDVEASATVAAVDRSLEALRGEPDPRRAVIAAYGAMELSLSGAGFGRRRSEAPLEYLRRVLAVPRLAADEIGTLTNLFQHAKFSRHAVDEPMRNRAITALERIRVATGGPA